jgi:hypothetical protein
MTVDEGSMPAQQRVGGDEAMAPALFGQEPGQGCEHGTIWPGETWSGDLSAQDRDFLPEHQDLGVLVSLPAREQFDPAEELAQDEVEESECHGRTSSRGSTADAKPHVNLGDDVSGTYTLWFADGRGTTAVPRTLQRAGLVDIRPTSTAQDNHARTSIRQYQFKDTPG